MNNIVKARKLDICVFVFQIVLGSLSIIFGGIKDKGMFLAMGLAVWCGGVASFMTLLKNLKQYDEEALEMFDERAGFIEGKAAAIAFKITILCLELLFVLSIILKSQYSYIFTLSIGGVLFITLIIYNLVYNWYEKKH